MDDGGVLNLNGNGATVTSLNSSYYSQPNAADGTISDYSHPVYAATTTLTVDVGGTPGVFAGSITNGATNLVALDVEAQADIADPIGGEGLLMTLTGDNTYTGGTYTWGGLQIGDGTSNGFIAGVVTLGGGDADDLVFDVATGPTEVFNGQIASNEGGSLLKIGGGTLELTGSLNNYDGLTCVEGGKLQLGNATSISRERDHRGRRRRNARS